MAGRQLLRQMLEGVGRTGSRGQPTARSRATIWAVHQSAQPWREDKERVDRLVGSPEISKLLRT